VGRIEALKAEEVVRLQRTRQKGESRASPLSEYSAPGTCGKARGVRQHGRVDARNGGNGSHEMRVLSTDGSRGDVEPMAGFALKLPTLGVEVQVYTPPHRAESLRNVRVTLVPKGVWR
jgi:hypothetical protein